MSAKTFIIGSAVVALGITAFVAIRHKDLDRQEKKIPWQTTVHRRGG